MVAKTQLGMVIQAYQRATPDVEKVYHRKCVVYMEYIHKRKIIISY